MKDSRPKTADGWKMEKLTSALALFTITPTPRNHEKESGASGVSTNPASNTFSHLLRRILSNHAGVGWERGLYRNRSGAIPASDHCITVS